MWVILRRVGLEARVFLGVYAKCEFFRGNAGILC